MAIPIHILVGTMTGTAQLVADEIESFLKRRGVAVDVELMDDLGVDAFDRDGLYLICSSTFGQGDVPDNARAFYAALKDQRPDLSRISYGMVALGDKTYADTFCRGGLQFDELLQSLGASRIGALLTCDASSGDLAEDVALDWIEGWYELAEPLLKSAA